MGVCQPCQSGQFFALPPVARQTDGGRGTLIIAPLVVLGLLAAGAAVVWWSSR